jgi:hypothetical protein
MAELDGMGRKYSNFHRKTNVLSLVRTFRRFVSLDVQALTGHQAAALSFG